MLAPDDRQLLLSQLQPPPEMQLRHAVGTTFTLDLPSALVAPLGAASRALTDIGRTHPIAVLDALRSTVDRIDVFYQNGFLAVPQYYSKLFAFLDQALHPVRPPSPGHLFHPKLWLLEFSEIDGDAPVAYRLIVCTRNLTADLSWDLVVSLDGAPGTRPTAGNRPLAALIRHLPELAHQPLPSRREERIYALAESARRIAWQLPAGVHDVAFHTFGVPGERAVPDFSGHRGLVMSPFISIGGLQRVTSGMRAVSIVSRPDQLAMMTDDELTQVSTDIKVITPMAGLTTDESESADNSAPGSLLDGLHAKVFVAERTGGAHFFTGSLNATENAFTGNVEFLLEIVGPRKEFGVDAILGTDGMAAILEPFARPDVAPAEPDPADALLETAAAGLATLDLICRVANESGRLTARITSPEPVGLPPGITATLAIAGTHGHALELVAGQLLDGTITGLTVDELTAWAELTVQDERQLTRAVLLKMRLIGDPTDRLDAVLASQIDSTDKFLALIRLLLTLEDEVKGMEISDSVGDAEGFFGDATHQGLFESLVRALARKPEALHAIGDLIDRLERRGSTDVIPDGLQRLWPQFEAASRTLSGANA